MIRSSIGHWCALFVLSFALLLSFAVEARAEVYVHTGVLQFGWTPAAGDVDYYEVYVNRNEAGFPTIPDATVTQGQSVPTIRMNAQDNFRYEVRVRAVSDSYGPGPFSDSSDQVWVFLHGSQGDVDGDGLPNAWEERYGFSPYDPRDARNDADYDGLTNLQEYLLGLDPLRADSDGDGIEDGQEVPVAHAGRDFLASVEGYTILDGRESRDPSGRTLTYSWRQKEGPSILLENAHGSTPRFLAAAPGAYVFELRVSNGVLGSIADEVSVAVVETFCPGDVFPIRDPDGTLGFLDLVTAWSFIFGGIEPDQEKFDILDVGPMVILDDSTSPVSIRLKPDGVLDSKDWEVLEGIYDERYRVSGWEIEIDAP